MATNSQQTPPPTRPANSGHDEEHPSTHHDDLQEFLTDAKTFWERWGNIVLTVVLVLLAALLLYRWLSGREARIREAAYTALAETSTPMGKQEVAMRYDNVPGLAGKARLDAADILLNEALTPAGPDGPDTPAPRADKLEQAGTLYQRVIELNQSPLQVTYARFGLAAVNESLGKFDAARQQYEAIQKEAADAYPALAKQAEQRAATLAEIAEPVTFPPPASQPEAEAAADGATPQTPAPNAAAPATPSAPAPAPAAPVPAPEAPAAPAPAPQN